MFSATVFHSALAQSQQNSEELNRLSAKWQKQREAQMILAKQKANELGLDLRSEFEDGSIIELQGIDDRGNLLFYKTVNRDAARTISTDKVWPGGGLGLTLTGASMTAGEWDGGAVRTTHQELSGRVTQVDSAAAIGNHPTHVAGTIIGAGVVSLAQGMAYGADLDEVCSAGRGWSLYWIPWSHWSWKLCQDGS